MQYKINCKKYYDGRVERYIDTYKKNYKGYPGNQKRLDIIRDLIRRYSPERVLYIGCGACMPMALLTREFECEIHGIDFSKGMVERGSKVLKDYGINPELVQIGDIEDLETLPEGLFDFVIAAGVFTHLYDDDKALNNLSKKLKPGGVLVTEFRNELFSCYSFNAFSYDFVFNSLLEGADLSQEFKVKVERFFKERFGILPDKEMTPESTYLKNGIMNKFHNPLNISEILKRWGFSWKENYFYHFHALPPQFEKIAPGFYKKLSLDIEDPLNWRGYIMASAFVSEAVKV